LWKPLMRKLRASGNDWVRYFLWRSNIWKDLMRKLRAPENDWVRYFL
ncbi:MAG: hypothetical protein F6K39_30600, partial [Okeania sp. SIO3B3]|nr:hypothetical protein [Okeania sp. SIO3B3]